jgi:dTDP-4-amino-4,6-dideoxygalactose transaminase
LRSPCARSGSVAADEVVVPSISFFATVEQVVTIGATPVLMVAT